MAGTFRFRGFEIPDRLALRTGGGRDTFEEVSNGHLSSIQLYFDIVSGTSVLELGCGVGRDAIPLIEMIGQKGYYLGTDIDRETINWCREHITKQHPNFRFEFFDIRNELYNPEGRLETSECPIPSEDDSFDLVILQSVFTHLPEEDIAFYMSEFSRVLRPGGTLYSTFFLLDEETLLRIRNSKFATFPNQVNEGAWIQDARWPSGARGYSLDKIRSLLKNTQLMIHHGPYYGSWSGRTTTAVVDPGQDIIIFKKGP
jgi:SAM-dependent methyltransferase